MTSHNPNGENNPNESIDNNDKNSDESTTRDRHQTDSDYESMRNNNSPGSSTPQLLTWSSNVSSKCNLKSASSQNDDDKPKEKSRRKSVQPNLPKFAVKLHKKVPILGQILTLISVLIMNFTAALVRILEDVDTFEIVGYRNFVVFLVSACMAVRLNGAKLLPMENKRWALLLGRAFTTNTQLLIAFYSFRNMPLGDVRMIMAASPIWVTILGRLFLKESCGVFEVVTISATMVGIVIVMQPPILFGEDAANILVNATANATEISHFEAEKKETHFLVSIILLCGTVIGSFGTICTRTLKVPA